MMKPDASHGMGEADSSGSCWLRNAFSFEVLSLVRRDDRLPKSKQVPPRQLWQNRRCLIPPHPVVLVKLIIWMEIIRDAYIVGSEQRAINGWQEQCEPQAANAAALRALRIVKNWNQLPHPAAANDGLEYQDVSLAER